jgi:DNA-binding response OmpR family regulator
MAAILVIDDDEIMNDMLVQLLTDAGYDVDSARDGLQGMKRIDARQYDLIITDIVMPEKEGIETIMEIRKRHKTVPIIAISGGGKLGPQQYLHMAQQFGADYAFPKPFNNEHFLGAVRECLS